MSLKNLSIIILLLLSGLPSFAQFYSVGDNPASVKWSFIESPHFKVIYPRGQDSLALSYMQNLERYRIPVSGSIGYIPGEWMKRKIPVVLHAFNATSNGSVAWAPKRMDLFTSPQGYAPEPMPWTQMLAIHESRHVAQMQFGLSHIFMPFKYIFGEMFNGALAGLYPSRWLLEGDAVATETALSKSGRGRVSNFLNYYRVAFGNGDFRNMERWEYGSYKHYTPNHYAYGYMGISGLRYLYDTPDYAARMFHFYGRRPYNLNARNHVSRKLTGKKYRDVFVETMHLYDSLWKENKSDRAPFIPAEKVVREPVEYTEYSDNLIIGDQLYTLRNRFSKSSRLVKVDSTGKEHTEAVFSDQVGMLYHSPGMDRVFWSETVPDPRWSLKQKSVIRYMTIGSRKKKTLNRKGRMFNPNPSPTEAHIAVTEYLDNGRSALVILNGKTGNKEISFTAPDSLQLMESAWLGDKIYATAVSGNGYGIYHIEVDELHAHDSAATIHSHHPYRQDRKDFVWKTTLAPTPVMITGFGTHGNSLVFTSDRNGVDELYRMDPENGKVFQITSTEYGASDFTYNSDGRYLIFSAAEKRGKILRKVRTDSLLDREVDFNERYVYEIAEKMARQERSIAEEKGYSLNDTTVFPATSPEKYRRFPRMFNIHSWAPVYFNYDNIMNMSFDRIYDLASLGATAIMQNRLGNFTGFVGYGAHKDPDNRAKWRHSGHVKFLYSGLYPVIEADFNVNDRAARTRYKSDILANGFHTGSTYSDRLRETPFLEGSLSLYIPFNFSSGGWRRGLIPKITYEISNDRFDRSHLLVKAEHDYITNETSYTPIAATPGNSSIYQRASLSLRYYMMLSPGHSEIFPEWGFGVEAGSTFNPGLTDFISASAYLYAYGFVPGFYRTQGLKLSVLYNQKLFSRDMSNSVNVLPRGLASASGLYSHSAAAPYGVRLSADYAIPFYMGDFHIGPVFYVKRGILSPHFDYSFMGKDQLLSAGATLEIEFGKFLGISMPITLGVTYSWNGGKSFQALKGMGIRMDRHNVGPVINISF